MKDKDYYYKGSDYSKSNITGKGSTTPGQSQTDRTRQQQQDKTRQQPGQGQNQDPRRPLDPSQKDKDKLIK